ncbi:MAG: type II secretion system F family protein [Methylomonas sp.]|nr:type II secretion system F family protein [Methylomonas sp.]PPD20490.1 MAG: secretion system protein [Methylomonas sp.]PPD52916.1 MAG: secretion system protein [Methylomonas sp.]
MTQFRYRAVNPEGKVVSGTRDCASAAELALLLGRFNQELIGCREIQPLLGRLGKRKIGRRDLINFCFYLQQMLGSGIALIDALADLQISLAPSYFSDIVGLLIIEIRGGKPFSEALQVFPEVFSSSFISLIKAGERSGELPRVLQDLSVSLRWQDELIAQTKKALTLPAFVAVVVFGVVFFLMTYLVPQMVAFITSMNQTLPFHTQLLILVSNFFVDYWYVVLFAPVLLVTALRTLIRKNPQARLLYDRYKLKVWLFGPILQKIILARFVNYLALLYNAGIPILDSLAITESVVDNKAIEQEIAEIRILVSQGTGIAAAFELGQLFPRLVISMIGVGEKTGDLGSALLNVSYFYKRDVDEAIEAMQRLIEPMMTLVLGAIIGWVMLSVLGPIYDLIANIQP